MLYAMAMAIAGLSSDLTEFDGESAEHSCWICSTSQPIRRTR